MAGTGNTRSAGRLEIEVAAKTDKFDRDMNRVKRDAMKAAKEYEAGHKKVAASSKLAKVAMAAYVVTLTAAAVALTGFTAVLLAAGIASTKFAQSIGRKLGIPVERFSFTLAGTTKEMGVFSRSMTLAKNHARALAVGGVIIASTAVLGLSAVLNIAAAAGLSFVAMLGLSGLASTKLGKDISRILHLPLERLAFKLADGAENAGLFAKAMMRVRYSASQMKGGFGVVLEKLVSTTKAVGEGVSKFMAPVLVKLDPLFTRLSAAASLVTSKFSKLAKTMAGPLSKAWRHILRFTNDAVSNVLELANVALAGLSSAFIKLGHRLREEGVILNGVGHAFNGLGHAIERINGLVKFAISIWTKFKLGLVSTVGVIGIMAHKMGKDFEISFARVETLLKGAPTRVVKDLAEGVRALASEYGVASQQINDTLYQTLSALPRLAEDTAGAMKIVEAATLVASTGFADAATAVRLITGLMNAYKLEADSAIPIIDAVFAAQDQGVTTFQEMADAIPPVASLVATLGGSYEELLAIVATITPFTSTQEALTGMESVLAGILDKSPEMVEKWDEMAKAVGGSKLDLSAASINAMGFLETFEEIMRVTQRSPDLIFELFGRREAKIFFTQLLKGMDDLRDKYEIVGDAAGTSGKNLEIFNKKAERQKEIMGQSFKGLLEEMGVSFDRGSARFYHVLAQMLDGARSFVQQLKDILTPSEWGTAFAPTREDLGRWEQEFQDVLRTVWQERIFQKNLGILTKNIGDDTSFSLAELFGKRGKVLEPQWGSDYESWFSPAKGPRGRYMVDDAGRIVWTYDTDLPPQHIRERFAGVVKGAGTLLRGAPLQRPLDVTGMTTGLGGLPLPLTTPMTSATRAFDRDVERPPFAGLKAEEAMERIAKARAQMQIQLIARAYREGDASVIADGAKDLSERMNKVILGEIAKMAEMGAPPEVLQAFYEMLFIPTDETKQKAKEATEALLAIVGSAAERQLSEGFDGLGPRGQELMSAIIADEAAIAQTMQQMAKADSEAAVVAGRGHIEMLKARIRERATEIEQLGELAFLHEALGEEIDTWLGYLESADPFTQAKFSEAITIGVTAMKELVELQAAYDNAVTEGADSAVILAHKKALDAAKTAIKEVIKEIMEMLRDLGLTEAQIKAIEARMKELGGFTPPDGSFWEKLDDYSTLIEGVARGLLSVGNALGLIDDKSEKALRGLIDMAEAGATLAASIPSGNIAGIIGGSAQMLGGLVSLAGGLFGESEAEKQRREMLQKNTDALRQLRDSVDRQREIALSATGEDIARALAVARGETVDLKFYDPRTWSQAFDDWRELQDILDELGSGISIFTEEGKLSTEALKQAAEFLSELQVGDVFQGWEGSLDRIRREIALYDLDEPLEQLKKYYEALKKAGTNLEIPEFDLDTAQGRQDFEIWLQDLFTRFPDLTFGELGKLSAEDLLEFISTAEGLIDSIDEDLESTSFQVFRGITEVTANRLAGLLTTDVYWNEQTAKNTAELIELMGGTVPPIDPPVDRPDSRDDILNRDGKDPATLTAPTAQASGGVAIGQLQVNVYEAQDMDAAELSGVIVDRVERDLGNRLIRQQRAGGGMLTRTVR